MIILEQAEITEQELLEQLEIVRGYELEQGHTHETSD